MGRIARLLPKIPKNRVSVLSTTLYGIGRKEKSLAEQVREILTKYSGTMLIPGPEGMLVESFQPGNYRESTGQTLAAADQQVGFGVDAARAPGPELMTNGDFSNGLTGWSSIGTGGTRTVVSGRVQITGGTGPGLRQGGLISGRTYRASMYARRISGTANAFVTGGGLNPAGATVTWVFNASATNFDFGISGDSSTTTWEFGEISVRELPGIHASQPTSGFQPYLRKVPKTLGPELRAGFSPNVIGVATPAVYDAAAGTATLYRVDVNNQSRLGISGLDMSKKYLVEVTNNGPASISVRTNNGANVKVNALAGERISYVAELETTPDLMIVGGTNGSSASISGISVREVIEWTYAWQFDGTDDRLSLSAVPFLITDDFWVVCAYTNTNAAGDAKLLSLRNTADGNPLIELAIEGRNPILQVRNNAGILSKISSPAVPVSTPAVVSAVKQASTANLRVDGVQNPSSINLSSIGALTLNSAAICASGSGTPAFFLEGRMHGLAIGKGVITPTEIITLEKFIARLQGRNL